MKRDFFPILPLFPLGPHWSGQGALCLLGNHIWGSPKRITGSRATAEDRQEKSLFVARQALDIAICFAPHYSSQGLQ